MSEIKQSELDQLRDDAAKLRALEAGGVDNWEGYDISLEEYQKQKDAEEHQLAILDQIMEQLAIGVYEPSERGAGFAFTEDAIQAARNIILGRN